MALAASFIGAAGALMQASAAAQQADYQKAVATMNAQIARDNARRARERAQVEQQTQDMISMQQMGELESIQGASGINLGSPSSFMARKAAARMGRLTALNVIQKGELEAHNHLVTASNQQALADSINPTDNLVEGFLTAGGLVARGFANRQSLVGGSVSSSRSFAPVPNPRPLLLT